MTSRCILFGTGGDVAFTVGNGGKFATTNTGIELLEMPL